MHLLCQIWGLGKVFYVGSNRSGTSATPTISAMARPAKKYWELKFEFWLGFGGKFKNDIAQMTSD